MIDEHVISGHLLELFQGEVADRLERLQDALARLSKARHPGGEELERRQLRGEAHGIKGAAAVVGREDIRRLAGELEEIAAAGDPLALDLVDDLLAELAARLSGGEHRRAARATAPA